MKILWKKILLLVPLAFDAALAGCGAAGEAGVAHLRLIVSAEARPYTDGIAECLADYRKRIGVAVDVEVVSATRLLARLEAAEPPDLVLTSDPALMRALVARGLAGPERWLLERRRDRVALVARRDDATTLTRLEDLARLGLGAIGLTDHVYSNVGLVTGLALRRIGLFAKLESRLRYYESQARLADALRRGEVRMGFIRETGLKEHGAALRALLVFDPVEDAVPPYVAFGVSRRSAQPVRAHQCWGALEMFFRNSERYLIDATPAGNMFALENMAN